jgi:hypothetical protein
MAGGACNRAKNGYTIDAQHRAYERTRGGAPAVLAL